MTTPTTLPTSSNHTNNPANIQQPHQQPYQHPATTPTTLPMKTLPTTSLHLTTSTRPAINQLPIDHVSRTDLYIIQPINLHHFLVTLLPLRLFWLFTLIHICKPSRVNILIVPATRVHSFPKSISPKVHIVAWIEFELAYLEVAVQNF